MSICLIKAIDSFNDGGDHARGRDCDGDDHDANVRGDGHGGDDCGCDVSDHEPPPHHQLFTL